MNFLAQEIDKGSEAIAEISFNFSDPISEAFDNILQEVFGNFEITVKFGFGGCDLRVGGDPVWLDSSERYYEVIDALDDMTRLIIYGDPFYIDYVGKYAKS